MIKPRLAAIDIIFTSPPTHLTAGAVLLKGEGAVKQRSFINQNRIFLDDKATFSGN